MQADGATPIAANLRTEGDGLEQPTGPSIASTPVPTADAIQNTTDLAGGGVGTNTPIVVAGGDTNIIGGESGGLGLTVSATDPRATDPVFQRAQNKRWGLS